MERAGLSWIERFLRQAKPRVIPYDRGERPVVLLTDGAVEATVTVGAVLFDPVSGLLEFAGAAVPRKVELSWGRLTHEQVIGQAEVAPLALAAYTWRDVLRGRKVLVFVDNHSAIGAVVKGYSPSLPSAKLVGRFWRLAAEQEMLPWLDWVPGPSNIADAPSRLNFEKLKELGGTQRCWDQVDWDLLDEV